MKDSEEPEPRKPYAAPKPIEASEIDWSRVWVPRAVGDCALPSDQFVTEMRIAIEERTGLDPSAHQFTGFILEKKWDEESLEELNHRLCSLGVDSPLTWERFKSLEQAILGLCKQSMRAEGHRPEIIASGQSRITKLKMINMLANDSHAKLCEARYGLQPHDRILVTRGGRFAQLRPSPEGKPEIIEAKLSHMMDALTDGADWVKVKITENKEGERGITRIASRPPRDLASEIESHVPSNIPAIERIVATPVFDSNGNLMDRPGYHRAQGTWVESVDPSIKIKPVPEEPTEEQVSAARRLLEEGLLGDFPFAPLSTSSHPHADRTHIIVSVLEPYVRNMIEGPSPARYIGAPDVGAGKTLLASLPHIIFTGQEPGRRKLSSDENEVRKAITSELYLGSSTILFDNVLDGSSIDSAALAAVLTSTQWTDRELGKTNMLSLCNDALWIFTGNNNSFSQEIARRIICSRVATGIDSTKQHDRVFERPLPQWAIENRGELIHACLTIIQAWIAKDCPKGKQRLSSFDSWCDVMGGICEVAAIEGFLGNLQEVQEYGNEDRAEWVELFEVWYGLAEDEDSKVGLQQKPNDLFEICQKNDLLQSVRGAGSDHAQLCRFGIALKAHCDRVYAPWRLTLSGQGRTRSKLYRLEVTEPAHLPESPRSPSAEKERGSP